MADLSLRLLVDADQADSRLAKVERDLANMQRAMRCGNCGAPWERCCSYCGRGEPVAHVHQRPRPPPTAVPGPGSKTSY